MKRRVSGVARRRLVRRWYQDDRGRLPLHPRDTDAHWRKLAKGRPAVLGYKQNVLVDRRGLMLAQRITHSTVRDPDPVPQLLEDASGYWPPIPATAWADCAGCWRGRASKRTFRSTRGIGPTVPSVRDFT